MGNCLHLITACTLFQPPGNSCTLKFHDVVGLHWAPDARAGVIVTRGSCHYLRRHWLLCDAIAAISEFLVRTY
jgi:hypothetical protein